MSCYFLKCNKQIRTKWPYFIQKYVQIYDRVGVSRIPSFLFVHKTHVQQITTAAATDYLLPYLLFSPISAGVKNPSGQVLNEADSLCDAHLLFFGQLCRQPGLTGSGMVNRYMDLLLNKHTSKQNVIHHI